MSEEIIPARIEKKRFSLDRNLLLMLVLSGGLGTTAGAGSANLFAPAQTQYAELQNRTEKNAEQIAALIRAVERQEQSTREFYAKTWSELQRTLGDINARLQSIERRLD